MSFVTAVPHPLWVKYQISASPGAPRIWLLGSQVLPCGQDYLILLRKRLHKDRQPERPYPHLNLKVCNGPDPVQGVFDTPNSSFFTWMRETRPENSQLDLNEWPYPHLFVWVSEWVRVCVCVRERIRHKSRCFCAKNWPMEIFISCLQNSFVKALKEAAVMVMGAYRSIILKTFLCIYVLLNKNVESEKTTVSCHTLFSTSLVCWVASVCTVKPRQRNHSQCG